jgi:hypothetical protein
MQAIRISARTQLALHLHNPLHTSSYQLAPMMLAASARHGNSTTMCHVLFHNWNELWHPIPAYSTFLRYNTRTYAVITHSALEGADNRRHVLSAVLRPEHTLQLPVHMPALEIASAVFPTYLPGYSKSGAERKHEITLLLPIGTPA